MNRAVHAAATLGLLFTILQARAQPSAPPAPEPATLRGESAQTRKRLFEIEQKLIAGKHADAADDLQRVLDESGDDLILVEANYARPARLVAHQILAKLPGDVLKAYQDRVDQPAKKLLAQAKLARDPRPLWQLLDRYFVSHAADEALLLLGDFLFERGEFRAAEGMWRRLVPDAGADVTYPNSKADLALVRARIVLAVIFTGDTARAKEEFDAFQTKHPTATGTLAGKTGLLTGTLKTFLDAPPKLTPEATTNAWPTYGGNPERTGRVPGGIPRYWPSKTSWEKALGPVDERPGGPLGTLNPPARQPFGHPVILNGEVFVADATRVFGFNLQTGEPTRAYNRNATPKTPAACASLTASGGLLYARFGPSVVRAPEAVSGVPEESSLVCFKPQGDELKQLWRLSPPEDPKVPAAWEGAPLVVGKRLWAVYAKFEGGRVVHVAVGYDSVEGDNEPQRPAWIVDLCDSGQPVSNDMRTRQELLTLAGRHIVFCSNAGAVVAIDAATGQRAWGFRYARSRKAAAHPGGDPSPAVAFGGRVFVAPADGERVYALDAHTGQLVWESGPTEGARIVGVANNRLVVSVTGPVRGLRGLALDTGSHRPADGGWVQSNGGGTLPYGQGLVTDDVILWPSREGLYFADPDTGRPTDARPNPWRAPFPNFLKNYFGHLAYADGVLVVVTPTQVWGYRAEPDKIVPRPDSTPRDRFDIIVESAEREYATNNRAEAKRLLCEVATSDLPAPLRAWAAARLIQWSPRVSDHKMLPLPVPNALRPELMGEWLLGADGIPVTLETFLQQHLGRVPRAASVPATASDNKPRVPGLTTDADLDRTLKLPAGVSPLRAIAGVSCSSKRLFAAGLQKVVAIPLDQSVESEHVAAEVFTHAADLREGFVAVGPYAVAVYGVAREPVWVFRVPATERLPNGTLPYRLRAAEASLAPSLSSFVLAGPWLLARIGEYHLIALDLHAHRVAWVLGATGRSGYEPLQFASNPRFGPHFAVHGEFVVAQLSDGRRWFVKLKTGRLAAQPALGENTARVNWPHAPTEVSNHLALADGAGLVRLVQLAGRVKWAYEVDHDDGLAGDPPQVRAWGDSVLIAVRRNHGIEIECVSATDGKRVWETPAFADADRIDLFAADADADHVYVPVANKLFAFTLSDGKTAWTADLPASPTGWVVRAGKSCVVAYPAQATPHEPMETVLTRLTKSFQAEPYVWRLPGLGATLYDAWVDRALPVLLFDPETGKRLGRYDIPARGPSVTVWFDADTAVFATGDRVVWLK